MEQTAIQKMTTERLKEVTDNFWTNFCEVDGDDIKHIEPRTYVKEDFPKGSIAYLIFEEYENRIK